MGIRQALVDAGYEPYSYSGRGMFGRRCVAVDVESAAQLFELGFDLGQYGDSDSRRRPSTDGMGLGMVAYWPYEEWTDED